MYNITRLQHLIKQVKTETGITNAALAKHLGIGYGTIYNWMSNDEHRWPNAKRTETIILKLQSILDGGEDMTQYTVKDGLIEDVKINPVVDVIPILVKQKEQYERRHDGIIAQMTALMNERDAMASKIEKIETAIEALRDLKCEQG